MLLEVIDVSFYYGKKQILNSINLHINKGDRLVIIGNNGVGKSTLIKCLNRMINPKEGTIILDDKPLDSYKQNDIAKKIAYVPQSISLIDQTVFEAVLLGRKPYIKFQPSMNDYLITEKTIEDLSLSNIASKNTNKLSGGEKQKIAIAQALNQGTEIILLDEPTANLDIKNQIEVTDFIKKISIEKQITMIITMHDINLALKTGTKFLVLKDAKVYKYGDESIITRELIEDVFNVSIETIIHNKQKNILFN